MLRKQPKIQLIPCCISKLGSFIVWSCHATILLLLVFHNIENIFHLLITPFSHVVKTLKRRGVGNWVLVRISAYSFWRWHVLRINIFEFVTWESYRLVASFNQAHFLRLILLLFDQQPFLFESWFLRPHQESLVVDHVFSCGWLWKRVLKILVFFVAILKLCLILWLPISVGSSYLLRHPLHDEPSRTPRWL